MADKGKIYKVTSTAEKGSKLIRATSKSEVRAHLTRMFIIEIASSDDVATLYEAGEKVEEANQ